MMRMMIIFFGTVIYNITFKSLVKHAARQIIIAKSKLPLRKVGSRAPNIINSRSVVAGHKFWRFTVVAHLWVGDVKIEYKMIYAKPLKLGYLLFHPKSCSKTQNLQLQGD